MALDESVAREYREIALSQKSGVLVWESSEVKRKLFFELGLAVGARSSLETERLGQLLLRYGRIGAAELEHAVDFLRSGKKLGQILVELGYLTGGEIEPHVRLHMLDIGRRMLESCPVRLLFSDKVSVEADTLAPLPVADIFMEAARRLPDVAEYRATLLRDDTRLSLASDPRRRSQRVSLTPEEAFVLSRIDGNERVAAVLAESALPEERTIRVLLGLLEAGIIEREVAAAPRPVKPPVLVHPARPRDPSVGPDEQEINELFNAIQCQNHWQVLGVGWGAAKADVERAYQEKSSRYRPDRYRHVTDLDFQEKLSFVLARITDAYSVLSSGPKARHYRELAEKEAQYEEKSRLWYAPTHPSPDAPQKNPQEAQRLFNRARQAFARSDFWETIELARIAIEIGEAQPEYFYLLGQALGHNPKWRQDAERNLKIAMNLSPWEPRYYLAMAELYDREGLHLRAQKVREHVAAMDPTYALTGSAAEPGVDGSS